MKSRLDSAGVITGRKPARIVTEIRLRDDAHPSDFRVPLPGSKAAIANGCTCPPQPEWPIVAFASDCPLHVGDIER
jgi:hypothetical protein